MGGVRHFKINGLSGDFAGLNGGPSGDQTKTAPEFERTCENITSSADVPPQENPFVLV